MKQEQLLNHDQLLDVFLHVAEGVSTANKWEIVQTLLEVYQRGRRDGEKEVSDMWVRAIKGANK